MQADLLTLSVSCVTYNTEPSILSSAIASLEEACKSAGIIRSTTLYLIDNGPNKENLKTLNEVEKKYSKAIKIVILSGHGNLGYGAGNNLAIRMATSKYHLVMNPDVIIAPNTIELMLQRMEQDENVGLLMPSSTDAQGSKLHLAKREPTITVLLARFLNLPSLNNLLKDQLDKYEYKDLDDRAPEDEIELASGCFMLCRSLSLMKIGGFNEKYFMYFEDFDLSRRLNKHYRILRLNNAHITHLGGNAGRKGLKHVSFFFTSALRYFFI